MQTNVMAPSSSTVGTARNDIPHSPPDLLGPQAGLPSQKALNFTTAGLPIAFPPFRGDQLLCFWEVPMAKSMSARIDSEVLASAKDATQATKHSLT